MSDLKIDYSLTSKEALLFPLLPAYGLRHLRKKDWLNKTMGVIELFPLLGPVVALIERVIATLFEKSAKEPLTPKAIGNPEKWKERFKAKALNYFTQLQRGELQKTTDVDLSLTAEQEKILKEVIIELNQYKTDKAIIHGNNGRWIFSLKEIPGRIFKIEQSACPGGIDFQDRLADANKARQVIEEEKLHLLHVPRQKLIQLDVDGKMQEVLIEQNFDILHGTSIQNSLFEYCLADPALKPFLQECVRQLIIFILKTGYSDVRYDNNPLLSNGRGFGLIDLDTKGDFSAGLIFGYSTTGEDGILSCLTLEMLENLLPFLRKELSEAQFQSLNIGALKERICLRDKIRTNFPNYLEKHKVTKGQEKVKLPGCRYVQDHVNKVVHDNLGFHLPTERQFHINKHPEQARLEKLKQRGKIFDWMNAKSSGYYVWC